MAGSTPDPRSAFQEGPGEPVPSSGSAGPPQPGGHPRRGPGKMLGGTVRVLTALLVAAVMGYPSRRSATDLDATPRTTVTFDGKGVRGGCRELPPPVGSSGVGAGEQAGAGRENRKEAQSAFECFAAKTALRLSPVTWGPPNLGVLAVCPPTQSPLFSPRAVRGAAVQRAQPELHHAAAGGRAGHPLRGGPGGHLRPQRQQRGRRLAPHGERRPVPKQPPNGEGGFGPPSEPPPCHGGWFVRRWLLFPRRSIGKHPRRSGWTACRRAETTRYGQRRAAGRPPRRHRPVTGILLPSADRVLQPRAVPAEAEQHAPLHLRHLRLPPALCCHRESSRPRPRPLLGCSDPVSGRVALGWQRPGAVAVTQTPPVPTPALGLDFDPAAGWCWGRVGTQGGDRGVGRARVGGL